MHVYVSLLLRVVSLICVATGLFLALDRLQAENGREQDSTDEFDLFDLELGEFDLLQDEDLDL